MVIRTMDRIRSSITIAFIAVVIAGAFMTLNNATRAAAQDEPNPEVHAHITVEVKDGDDSFTWSDPDACSSDYNLYLASVTSVEGESQTTRSHIGSAASDVAEATHEMSFTGGSWVSVELYCGEYDAEADQGDLIAETRLSIAWPGYNRLRGGIFSSAPLAALSISSGSLSPDFDRGLSAYSAEVSGDVEVITLDPTALTGYVIDFIENPGWGILEGCSGNECTYSYGDQTTTGIVLSDADETTEGFQVNLKQGENRLGLGLNKGNEGAGGALYKLTVTRVVGGL